MFSIDILIVIFRVSVKLQATK